MTNTPKPMQAVVTVSHTLPPGAPLPRGVRPDGSLAAPPRLLRRVESPTSPTVPEAIVQVSLDATIWIKPDATVEELQNAILNMAEIIFRGMPKP